MTHSCLVLVRHNLWDNSYFINRHEICVQRLDRKSRRSQRVNGYSTLLDNSSSNMKLSPRMPEAKYTAG